jgi:hypothetical protein
MDEPDTVWTRVHANGTIAVVSLRGEKYAIAIAPNYGPIPLTALRGPLERVQRIADENHAARNPAIALLGPRSRDRHKPDGARCLSHAFAGHALPSSAHNPPQLIRERRRHLKGSPPVHRPRICRRLKDCSGVRSPSTARSRRRASSSAFSSRSSSGMWRRSRSCAAPHGWNPIWLRHTTAFRKRTSEPVRRRWRRKSSSCSSD